LNIRATPGLIKLYNTIFTESNYENHVINNGLFAIFLRFLVVFGGFVFVISVAVFVIFAYDIWAGGEEGWKWVNSSRRKTPMNVTGRTSGHAGSRVLIETS
jgi:hypothetical protein